MLSFLIYFMEDLNSSDFEFNLIWEDGFNLFQVISRK